MSVSINPYHADLAQRYQTEQSRLQKFLPPDVSIHHVGSSAAYIGGKNIIDILIGVNTPTEMPKIRDLLTRHGYTEGHDTHPDRIFMASRPGETGEGDYHIHICPRSAHSYQDMLLFRDFLRAHPDVAQEYEQMKHIFAKQAHYNRQTYKALKSAYVTNLLNKAKTLRE